MAPVQDDLRRVIAELEAALSELARLPEYSHVRLRAHGGASAELIARYEAHIGRRLPASYRAFLELHDGYEGLAYPGHMLSLQTLMPGGEWHQRIQEWKQRAARYGGGEVLDGIVIAQMGQPNSWAYLDPNQPSGTDELAVVEWDPEDSNEYPDVVAFLQECLETCRYGIDEAAGRAPTDEDVTD